MRLVVDALIALMLIGIAGGIVWHHLDKREQEVRLATTKQSVETIGTVIREHRNLARIEIDGGMPDTVAPSWFTRPLPENALLDGKRPWIEVASKRQADLEHPLNRVAVNEADAAFWYNPANGVVRARVPSNLGDADALKYYNMVNSTTLTDILMTPGPVVVD